MVDSRAVPSNSSRLHDGLGHPVIDCDGHSVEFMPVFEEYLREYAGAKAVEHYHKERPWFVSDFRDPTAAPSRQAALGLPNPGQGSSREHAAGLSSRSASERPGIDFAIIYPSPKRLGVPHEPNPELRIGICRAMNTYMADMLRPHARHLTPAAVIPMYTPEEAIARARPCCRRARHEGFNGRELRRASAPR